MKRTTKQSVTGVFDRRSFWQPLEPLRWRVWWERVRRRASRKAALKE